MIRKKTARVPRSKDKKFRVLDFLSMESGTTTRPTIAGSVLTTAKPSTFWGQPVGGCRLVTLISLMRKPHWRPCFKSKRPILPSLNRVYGVVKRSAGAICTHTYTASSTNGKMVTESCTWYGGKLALGPPMVAAWRKYPIVFCGMLWAWESFRLCLGG
jgi:hypothetical protein